MSIIFISVYMHLIHCYSVHNNHISSIFQRDSLDMTSKISRSANRTNASVSSSIPRSKSHEEMDTANFFFLFPAIHAIVECLLAVIFPVILHQIVVRPG